MAQAETLEQLEQEAKKLELQREALFQKIQKQKDAEKKRMAEESESEDDAKKEEKEFFLYFL